MKIIVTGGSGFIGSNLIKILKINGYEVISLTRRKSFEKDGVKYLNTDYHNLDILRKNIQGDIIIHLAATLFARNKKEFIKENVSTTKNIVKAAFENGIKKIIYISSLAAGGPSKNPNKPKMEIDQDSPVSYYGLSKLMGEWEIKKFHKWVILRPPIVYGPKDDGFSTIAKWVKKGIIISPSNPNSRFSFIFAQDLVKCIIKSLSDDIVNETFYVCEKNTYSWYEFIEEMSKSMNLKKPKIIKMPKSLMKLTALSFEIFSYIFNFKPILNRDKIREAIHYHWIASPQKWEEKTGFTHWTDIKEGFKKTFF
ncbi:MAG: NAD(P)-dependent oxidoreductase [Elusimicrobiales bacterium]|nr:NAD(P)-dependent oxidoreductase [Elusimicrobiales bacterium]